MFGEAVLRTPPLFSEASTGVPNHRHLSKRLREAIGWPRFRRDPAGVWLQYACGVALHSSLHSKLVITGWNISAITGESIHWVVLALIPVHSHPFTRFVGRIQAAHLRRVL